MGSMECYEKDWEEPLLKETAEYYRRKAAAWIQVGSRPASVPFFCLRGFTIWGLAPAWCCSSRPGGSLKPAGLGWGCGDH